ncbi:hypothetical protein A3C18_04180 [Candidatus Kaiserbacteria bacterium RIFCSPHIGHO2_02_FULL_54_11b]|uniref:Uncharacterized protein n=2 Tax=Candidatus Kaiseribacteriota TaxID=1752734 RepID=A0A1F6CSZ0_9BACT|nr:MAG: hypothetical protein A2704_00675 [Candidatus Kaiserbacteria bacterium RIFCSPHIGHO2_01_FULL_54_36b]OGG64907.1 MAG: hypothetical protein A3C18_04180 [Candidatus Kaiserbacteria bacterium RIFCSPHIGHO2_02_FULL_54_11b]
MLYAAAGKLREEIPDGDKPDLVRKRIDGFDFIRNAGDRHPMRQEKLEVQSRMFAEAVRVMAYHPADATLIGLSFERAADAHQELLDFDEDMRNFARTDLGRVRSG